MDSAAFRRLEEENGGGTLGDGVFDDEQPEERDRGNPFEALFGRGGLF